MIPNPILRVLSALGRNRVRHLLMGGQACVLYGAAEFSRDADIAVLPDPDNLDRLSQALAELQAECIAVPPFSADYLRRGHAVHFRCRHPDVAGLRIDVLSAMRGVAPFEELWARRTTVRDESGTEIESLALPDLVLAKKTQRDKDWPMIRRLVEAHYAQHRDGPSEEQIGFWLAAARTPVLLVEVARRFPERAVEAACLRPLLRHAAEGDVAALDAALREEEAAEREADRLYWTPLRAELERLRHGGR